MFIVCAFVPLLGCANTRTEEVFSKDGQLHARFTAKETSPGQWKPHGKYTKYHPDGTKAAEGSFVDGMKDGRWRSWRPNGKLASESYYERDRRDGTFRTWFANGMLAWECEYQDGQKHGTESQYHPNGQLRWRGEFAHNAMLGFRTYSAGGQLIQTYTPERGVEAVTHRLDDRTEAEKDRETKQD